MLWSAYINANTYTHMYNECTSHSANTITITCAPHTTVSRWLSDVDDGVAI